MDTTANHNYELINLDDYIQSGEGGMALTYNHKDGKTLAKLFTKGMGAETAEREFLVNKTVYEMGILTPKPIRLVTDGDRTLWIDVGDFAYGVPEWDLGMMFYSSNYMSEQRAISIFHLPMEVLRQHWAVFAKAYFCIEDPEELKKKQQALFPFFAVKMLFIISKIHNGSGAPSEMILSLIRRNLGM